MLQSEPKLASKFKAKTEKMRKTILLPRIKFQRQIWRLNLLRALDFLYLREIVSSKTKRGIHWKVISTVLCYPCR